MTLPDQLADQFSFLDFNPTPSLLFSRETLVIWKVNKAAHDLLGEKRIKASYVVQELLPSLGVDNLVTQTLSFNTAKGSVIAKLHFSTFFRDGQEFVWMAIHVLETFEHFLPNQFNSRSNPHVLHQLLNSIAEVCFALDNDWNFILTNRAFEKQAGCEKDEYIGKNFFALFPYLRGSTLAKRYAQAMEKQEPQHFEYASIKHPGVIYEIHAFPSREGLLVYYRDNTAQTKANAQIRYLSLIAEHTSNGVFLTDPHGVIQWMNKGFERISGYTAEEAIGKTPQQLLWGPDTSPEAIEKIRDAIEAGFHVKVEIQHYNKQRKPYWVDMEIIPLKDDQGELLGFISIELDITQLKNALEEMFRSQEQMQTILNNAPIDVFIKDLLGRYTFYNRTFCDHFLTDERSQVLTDFDIFSREEADGFVEIDQYIKKTGKTLTREQNVIQNGVNETYYTVNFPLFDSLGRIYSVGGVALQITKRKEMEQLLRESEQRYRSIVDHQREFICRFSKDGSLTFINRSFAGTFHVGDDDMKQQNIVQFFEGHDRQEVRRCADKIFNRELPHSLQEYKMTINGNEHWVEWFLLPLVDKFDNISELQAIGHDISHRKELEAEQVRMDRIVRNSHNEIFIISDSLAIEYLNASALKNLQYEAEEISGEKISKMFRHPDEMALEAILNTLRRGEADRLQLNLKFFRKDESSYDVDVLIQTLEQNKSFVIIASDITAKLVTEKKLIESLYEKEALIKEIHHRVKNNLQLISSIIYLKMVTLKQSEIKSFLESVRQKIRSISLIHEKLLQTQSMDRVEISDYLGELIRDIEVTYANIPLKITFKQHLERQMIGLDTCIMCGLIVNELVTNAIKHAFTGREQGMVSIDFRLSADKKYSVLSISDNGVTLPSHIAIGESDTFGMQLIDVFIKQINGSCEIVRDNGTSFIIKFCN